LFSLGSFLGQFLYREILAETVLIAACFSLGFILDLEDVGIMILRKVSEYLLDFKTLHSIEDSILMGVIKWGYVKYLKLVERADALERKVLTGLHVYKENGKQFERF
jgi:hypothetical protein